MKKVRFCVTETMVHECFAEIPEEEYNSLKDNEADFSNYLLEIFYEEGSDDILSDNTEVTDIED